MTDDRPLIDRDHDEEITAIRANLRDLYRELDEALAKLGPSCELSGRCCHFQDYGHTLFVTGPEARLLIADAPAPQREVDGGETCPWQDAKNRCTARDARPLGCRIFFCDPSYTEHASVISERFLDKLKRLVNRNGWSWNYAPLHTHLRQAQAEGVFPEPIIQADRLQRADASAG